MLQGFFVHQLLAVGQKGIPAIQLKTTKFAALATVLLHKTANAAKYRTNIYNRHRLVCRNYEVDHQKLL